MGSRVALCVLLAAAPGCFTMAELGDGDESECVGDACRDDSVVGGRPDAGGGEQEPAGDLAALILTGDVVIDTGSGTITQDGEVVRAGGSGVRNGVGFDLIGEGVAQLSVLRLETVDGGKVRIFGPSSLVIRTQSDVLIDGVIDVSAGLCADGTQASYCPGPGGSPGGRSVGTAGGCAPGGVGVADGDTGGGGGGFGADGADGGQETDELLAPGGAGGAVAVPPCPGPTMDTLRGGSGGGRGGGAPAAAGGGGGGGALAIYADGAVRFVGDGGINAAGGGGLGALSAGGSGGGAGGAILIEASSIDLGTAILAANGGGGGEGQGTGAGEAGRFGIEAALGGTGAATGRKGGSGGTGDATATTGAVGINDTGGGGGGVGIIVLRADSIEMSQATLSPAPAP